MVKKILVPIDASDYSLAAANYAIGFAKMSNASIVLIHVIERHPYYSLPYYLTAGADQALQKDIKKTAESWFAKIEEIAKKQNVNTKHDIILGSKSIIESIVSYAEDNKMDLIIMGTKGATGFKRLLVGSVARGVMEHARCPVLLVR